MKITIGRYEFEFTDEYSDDDIDSINCISFFTTIAAILMGTIWRIFVC